MNRHLAEARRTLVLAGPIIIGQVGQILMGVTDSVMIGRVGKVPLAASAFANSVFGFAFISGLGLLVPVAVLVSRAHGANDNRDCGEWLRHGVWLAVIVSAVETAALLLVGLELHRFGQPPEVLAQVHPYYELIAISLLPVFLFQVFRQYSESLGHPAGPMAVTLVSVALNVFLNWILIYGNLGAPALGLAGAGWATLASRIFAVAVVIAWLKTRAAFRASWPALWIGGVSRRRFKDMLALGIPAAASLMFEGGAFSAAAVLMGWLGATELAAHQIALSCAAFTFMFPLGISMAAGMRIGRAIGQGRFEDTQPIGFSALTMSACLMGAFALVFFVAGPGIAGWFVSESEVVMLAAQLLVIAGIFQLFDGSQVVAAGLLRGFLDVRIPTVITGVAYWIVALPLAWWLGFHTTLRARGIWIALAIGLAIAAVLLFSRFLHLAAKKEASSDERA
ncbi:MAG: MATE family efflux transporter [Opitutaceae bacterium]